MTRQEKSQKDMLEMAQRLRKKRMKLAEEKAKTIELPTQEDLDYWIENAKNFLK